MAIIDDEYSADDGYGDRFIAIILADVVVIVMMVVTVISVMTAKVIMIMIVMIKILTIRVQLFFIS